MYEGTPFLVSGSTTAVGRGFRGRIGGVLYCCGHVCVIYNHPKVGKKVGHGVWGEDGFGAKNRFKIFLPWPQVLNS